MDKIKISLPDNTIYMKKSYGLERDELKTALDVVVNFISEKSQQNAAWNGIRAALNTLEDLEFNGSDWDLHEVAIKLGGKDGDHPDKGGEYDIGKDYIWSRKGEETR
tara:strand:+ start:6148 stop:6468 length:321 start_codon:yes stop_codon:yes gene_type:complete